MSYRWNTERELARQPDVWASWSDELQQSAAKIRDWIETRRPEEIWLCGAGSSNFIADSLVASLNSASPGSVFRAIPTTDLVACPQLFLQIQKKRLVVSFGRSGNSPESTGTLNLLDALDRNADRLHITCNPKGVLASRSCPGPGEQHTIVLPENCNDAGFAMTSSFTTMLLTALACLGTDPINTIASRIAELSAAGEAFLKSPVGFPVPSRAVFLGSGPFVGTARESALKVLELTAGKVVTSWDTTLGFRHGPKAIVDNDTAVFVYLSSDTLTRRYDSDVANEIRTQYPQIPVTTIGVPSDDVNPPDIALAGTGSDLWDTVLFVVVAQGVAVSWSNALTLNVDNPFADGNLTRVVANVRLHQ